MDAIHTLATLLPLSLTSGINLYATVLMVGLSIRFHWITNTPAGLEVLASEPVIIFAAVLYALEFFADKIPFVDNLWDVLHTFIRPIGGALVGLATLGVVDPVISVLGALAAGGIALTSHGGKASARVALNVVSPVENISNISISILEDAIAVSLTFLALKYPYVALIVAALLLLVILIFTPILLRWVFFYARAVTIRLRSSGQQVTQSDALPEAHLALLNHLSLILIARCKSQGISGVGGRNGFAVLGRDEFLFTYDRWGRGRAWSIPRLRISEVCLRRRVLMDILEIHYYEDRNQHRLARFVFLKDRSVLAAQFESALRPRVPEVLK